MLTNRRSHRFRRATIGVAALVAALAGSCSDTGDGDSNSAGTSSTVVADDGSGADERPKMTIAEATTAADGTEVTVEGFLVVDSGVVVLAELLAESFPPQAGGTTIVVENFDPSSVTLEQNGPISWTNDPVTMTGSVVAGALTEAEIVNG